MENPADFSCIVGVVRINAATADNLAGIFQNRGKIPARFYRV
jgi:hypothetical protein